MTELWIFTINIRVISLSASVGIMCCVWFGVSVVFSIHVAGVFLAKFSSGDISVIILSLIEK